MLFDPGCANCGCPASCSHTIRVIPSCNSTAVYTGDVTVTGGGGFTQTVSGTGPDFVFSLPSAGSYTVSTAAGPTAHGPIPPTVRTLGCGATTTLTFPLDSAHVCWTSNNCPPSTPSPPSHIVSTTLTGNDSEYGGFTLTWNGVAFVGTKSAVWPGFPGSPVCTPTPVVMTYTVTPAGRLTVSISGSISGACGVPPSFALTACSGSGYSTTGVSNPVFFQYVITGSQTIMWGPGLASVTITVSE